MTNNPKSRDEQLVVQNLNDEVLIYDLAVNKAYTLNATSAAVWLLCNGQNSVRNIAEHLSKELKQPVTDELVYLALDQFKGDNLLADGKTFRIEFNGLSRRQVIKKVGLASMVALPVIVGLVAPTAAHALSGAGTQDNGTTCTNYADPTGSTECKSGKCTDTSAAIYTPGTGNQSYRYGGIKCCIVGGGGFTGSYTRGSGSSNTCNFSTLCCTGSGTEDYDAPRNRYYCTCDATS